MCASCNCGSVNDTIKIYGVKYKDADGDYDASPKGEKERH